MTQYRYSPLSGARQLRLLKLHPGAESAELSVDLITTSLDNAPSFTALSYPWGDPEPRQAIRCSGLAAEIWPSLHSALQHLRKLDSAMLVWADALCINQEDIPERTQQVRMMGEIYAAASTTVIWLGEESDEVKMAFGWLRRFDSIRDVSGLDPDVSNDKSGLIPWSLVQDLVWAVFGRHRDAAFGHIWALLDRPWFTRKWVIQELVKSPRPLLVAGRIPPLPWVALAAWMKFVEACPTAKTLFLRRRPERPPQEASREGPDTSMRRATTLTQIKATDNQTLLFLVTRTLIFRCGDPRDHLFTLVEIASNPDRFRPIIDYESPAEEVWRQLAYTCVLDSVSLKLLWSLILFAPLEQRLRSWVPNLDCVLAAGDGSIFASQFTTQQVRDYNASGDTVIEACLGNGGDTLNIRGRVLDRLQFLGLGNQADGNSYTLRSMMHREATVNEDCRLSNEKSLMAMERGHRWLEEYMAITDSEFYGQGQPEEGERQAKESFRYEFQFDKFRLDREQHTSLLRLQYLRKLEAERLGIPEESTGLKTHHPLDGNIQPKGHRRFSRTENGRTGWVPPISEEGDLVCVFDGMELPYVLRPSVAGRHLLIGECIMQGLMNGEAIGGVPGVSSEIIVLE
jgi:hypothetical protein